MFHDLGMKGRFRLMIVRLLIGQVFNASKRVIAIRSELGQVGARHRLPISYCPVTIKNPLQNLLLERMFPDLVFIDRNAQAGLRVGLHGASRFVDLKTLRDDVVSPGNVVMHRFADDVARLREPKLQ